MQNFYKYLPTSAADEHWGLYVLNAGWSRVNMLDEYPSPEHPAHHYFSWDKGRVLDEYQIIYITNGEGIFESTHFAQTIIREGSILLLFPGEWHRFKPDRQTGWNEYWVGFKGSIIENLIHHQFISIETPVVYIGVNETIIHLFTEIKEKTTTEKTGYQPLVSGIVLHLLGLIHSLSKQQHFELEDHTVAIINKARIIFRTSIGQQSSMEQVAEELNVSYAWFRKAFKQYTGISPNQYLLQLKIEKAKLLLSDHSKSIKEIAFGLHFESAFYFSKLFKDKTGVTPGQYRKSLER